MSGVGFAQYHKWVLGDPNPFMWFGANPHQKYFLKENFLFFAFILFCARGGTRMSFRLLGTPKKPLGFLRHSLCSFLFSYTGKLPFSRPLSRSSCLFDFMSYILFNLLLFCFVPGVGLEPTRRIIGQEPQSCAYTIPPPGLINRIQNY